MREWQLVVDRPGDEGGLVRRVQAAGSYGSRSTYYLRLGATLLANYDEELEPTRRFIHGLGGTIAVEEVEPTEYATRFLAKDRLGSVRLIVDAEGTPLEATTYWGYGEVYDALGEAVSGDFLRYTGQELDVELGYQEHGVRLYDPELGRWLQPEPLRALFPGVSLYAYALGNPLF